jgi:AraC-like DNA-binding protein
MTWSGKYLAGTTELGRRVDPFEDVLSDLRIAGSVLLHEAYSPPWSIQVPNELRLREALNLGADVRVLPFHLVRRRGFTLQIRGLEGVRVEAPEICICPSGDAHQLSVGRGAPVMALDAILAGRGARPANDDDASATELVCGVFTVRAAPLNPMLGALPKVIKVSTGDMATSPTLAAAADLLVGELGRGSVAGFTVARLLEICCAEALRAYQRTEGASTPSWFRGLSDAKIGEALRSIHLEPGRDWGVAQLAKRVALSPSRFAARFRETTGQSVMHYVASWRASFACRLLRETELALPEVAQRVGYLSFPAFSRAFKAQVGVSPAKWRALALRTATVQNVAW